MSQSSRRGLQALHDLELTALAAGGDGSAFGELVRRHGSGVRALLRRLGADSASADDLAQDAFLTAYERIAEFRGEGTFQGWVKRIAARAYLKRWRRRVDLESAEVLDPEAGDGGEAEADRQRRIDLDAALQSLSAAERLCITLAYGAGLSHAEAAEALDCPLGTVKSHVRRGLDKLKRRLDPDDGRAAEAGRRTRG